ncbi:hypothetical protein [Streptomyces sp. NPDC089919]|uniref:hypothetical protein n=1 Tax=Streptomyces sp. NPDC089919 TaxID=3155188 RepID=UPI003434E676
MPGPRPRRTALSLAALLAGAAAVIGGWTLAAPSDARPPAAAASGAPQRAAAAAATPAVLPVTERLFAWTEVDYRSADAQRRYAIACMARQGYRYAPAATPRPGTGADQRPEPFGRESATAPDAAAPPAEQPPVPGSPETTKAYGRALFGDPADRVTAKGLRMSVSRPGHGCLAEAENTVLGDGRMRWLQVRILLFEGQEQSRDDLEKDPAFQALNGRWRACMEQAGFGGKSDPVRLLTASARTAQARATDPALAADLRCKGSTGYLATAYARLSAAQQRWLDGHPDVARDWAALMSRQDAATRPRP